MKKPSRFSVAPSRQAKGFTLVELMIVVAVVAILAAIAYPSYTSYVRKGKRATAQAALMDLAGKQQTYLLDRRVYTTVQTDIGFAVPAEIQGAYTFTITCSPSDCTGFSATAAPAGGQAVSSEQSLTIDNTGAKTPANTSGYWGK
ncbi:type IV pilin protein [Variovorax ureilyticus]|uniref:Type IV pilin protein n=1 Tax=Variovorax ureilyticus TaxID=1836198 RepID=A0ABU8V990_9BURK